MNHLEQRLDYLEEINDNLRMQNRALAVAFKALITALPTDITQDVVEQIQIAFEDELAILSYEDSNQADLFQDIAYTFFQDKA